MSRRGNYDTLPLLLDMRQELLQEIQKIDTVGACEGEPPDEVEQDDCRMVIEKINAIDSEIRLGAACEIDVITEQLEVMKRGKAALKGYNRHYSAGYTLKDVRG
ncbi:MAG: flagellar protein FliT [Thermodesulfobacteriota bacterium]